MQNKTERKKFAGKLFDVFVRKEILPNGRRVALEIVRHPGAVLVLPVLHKNTVVILKQYRPVIKRYLYELPAGTLGRGETHVRCAHRELREETGYSAQKMIKCGIIFPAGGYTTERIVIFEAQQLTQGKFRPEPDEIIKILTVTRRQIRDLFRLGKIVDAKTICGLAMCGWL